MLFKDKALSLNLKIDETNQHYSIFRSKIYQNKKLYD